MTTGDLSKTRPIKDARPKCAAHKKDGSPCGRWPIKGGAVCPKHGGTAPQVRARAQERLAAAADWLIGELLRIAHLAENEQVRLAAIRDALDRAGLSARTAISLTLTPFDALTEQILSECITDSVFDKTSPRAKNVEHENAAAIEESPDCTPESHAVIENPSPYPAVPIAAPVPGTAHLSDRVPARIRDGQRPRDPGLPWAR